MRKLESLFAIGGTLSFHCLVLCMLWIGSVPVRSASGTVSSVALPSLTEALASKQDLWGLAAMQQPNGATYEFFADLLPPLRYVNAKFRHYPIVLSAPGAMQKARLVSNGSAINARAQLNTWKEIGVPVSFSVGDNRAIFGENLTALEGPKYERGYLPIVGLRYRIDESVWLEETFAATHAVLADHGVVFVRFALAEGKSDGVAARVQSPKPLRQEGQRLLDPDGKTWLAFDSSWHWDAETQTLTARLKSKQRAALAIASTPMEEPVSAFDAASYDTQRKLCAATWENVIARATQVETPERVVNDAWKSIVIGSLMLLKGDHMNYSAGNQYETMYEAESGDSVRALMLWGLREDVRGMIPPLLDYGINPGLKFHDAAFKLRLLTHYYQVTRDVDFVRAQRSRWEQCVQILTSQRDGTTGLLPRESYCGDIHNKVFSLNSNANAWRGLRDASQLFEVLGDLEQSQRASATADTLRAAILAAVQKSERRDVEPLFMPIALFGEEKPYERLTDTLLGSYWNLMIPYVIGSELFAGDPERENAMLRYLEEHGGLCMGMIRFHQHSGLFANEDGIDDLYGLRYVDALLRRDEVERALVSFYGKLAQGMTRETFLSAEGTGLKPLDSFGRPMYLPPTCSGGALYLWTLRSLLVQDYDLDHNGQPETLRLLFATPKHWLEDGKRITIQRAPTSFGEVSVRVESNLRKDEVVAVVDLPGRNLPAKTLMRIRVPDGYHVVSARSAAAGHLGTELDGTVDLSGLKGRQTIRFKTARTTQRSKAQSAYEWICVSAKAPFAPRDGAGALVFDNKMWLLGGWNPSDKVHFPLTCNNEVWNSANGVIWSLVKTNSFLNAQFDPAKDWEGRHTAGYAVFKNSMWLIGGDPIQGHYQSDIWKSSDGKNWNCVNIGRPVPWGPRVLHHTVVFKNRIWIMGGQTIPQIAPTEEKFYRDIWNTSDGVHWQQVTPREPYWPQRGLIGGSVVFKGRIWILGGGTYDTPQTPQRKFYNDIWSSADGVKWTLHVAEAPWAAREYHDVAVFDDRIWVLEGFNSTGGNRNDVWYSPDGVGWTELPNTPWKPRHAASVFVHDDALWVVSGNNMESDVWKLVRK